MPFQIDGLSVTKEELGWILDDLLSGNLKICEEIINFKQIFVAQDKINPNSFAYLQTERKKELLRKRGELYRQLDQHWQQL